MSSGHRPSPSTTHVTSGKLSRSPFLMALIEDQVHAEVTDIDHYRIHGGMAVETDYIIYVKPTASRRNTAIITPTNRQQQVQQQQQQRQRQPVGEQHYFDAFTISKTYSAFRSFANSLEKAADNVMSSAHSSKYRVPKDVVKVAKYCDHIVHLIESQKTRYIGKVNYKYVKVLAKQRSRIINDILEATLNGFPQNIDSHHFLTDIARIIETFFLTDHIEQESSSTLSSLVPNISTSAIKKAIGTNSTNFSSSYTSSSGRDKKLTKHLSETSIALSSSKTSNEDLTTPPDLTRSSSVGTPTSERQTNMLNDNTATTPPITNVSSKQKKAASALSPITTIQETAVLSPDSTGVGGTGDNDNSDDNGGGDVSLDIIGSGKDFAVRVPVEPFTRKVRCSEVAREQNIHELESVGTEATLLLDDDRAAKELAPSYSKPTPTYKSSGTKIGEMIEYNPIMFVGIAFVSIMALQVAKHLSVTMDVDIALLICFASFCVGLHTPRPLPGTGQPGDPVPGASRKSALSAIAAKTTSRTNRLDFTGARLLRRSIFLNTPTASRRASLKNIATLKSNRRASFQSSVGPLDESRDSYYSDSRDFQEDNNTQTNNVTTTTTTTNTQITEPAVEEDKPSYHTTPFEEILLTDSAIIDGSSDEDEDLEDDFLMSGPMERFPQGAKLGAHLNCWSEPEASTFSVRGPNYLKDKKKIKSSDYLFPARGADLFLTDTAPENVASNSSVFGGRLRDVPSFVLNFRLPWGVVLFYYEIPEKFVPYLKARYADPSVNADELNKKLKTLSAPDRTAARFLMGTDAHRDATLKIVPVVVQGPWVVKSVVGGKPAIIGTKLPVSWVYQPEEKINKKTKALYLEADLDIVSSSAARGILSVTRSYANVLTLDLGFVIQGNTEDELPECMLVGTRLHGIDPVTAPPLPPMKNNHILFEGAGNNDDDDNSFTERY